MTDAQRHLRHLASLGFERQDIANALDVRPRQVSRWRTGAPPNADAAARLKAWAEGELHLADGELRPARKPALKEILAHVDALDEADLGALWEHVRRLIVEKWGERSRQKVGSGATTSAMATATESTVQRAFRMPLSVAARIDYYASMRSKSKNQAVVEFFEDALPEPDAHWLAVWMASQSANDEEDSG